MRNSWILFLAVLGGSVFCRATDLGTLTGFVKDTVGAVVQDEAVLIVCRGGGVAEKHASTDAKGQYSVDLPAGSCDVFFSHGLFEPVAKSVRIDAGKKTVLNSQLRFRKGLKFIE